MTLAPGHDSKGVGVLGAQIAVPGYINPKYIIVGVIYAPPGQSSYVDYLNSTLVSSTVTTKTAYSSGYKEGTAVTISSSINGWKFGSIDTSSKASTSYSQATTTTDTTAVTVQKTTSTDLQVPGPACDYCGVDHDYDLIAVWLNPVKLYTLTNGGVVQPNGYGFSTFDQPGLDVYYVYAGELNGDIAMRTSTTTAFARAWAGTSNGFQYASGDGPGLTTPDEQNILKFDPYWNCTYKSAINDTADCAEPPDSTRYTQSTDASFPYQQPIPGGRPHSKDVQLVLHEHGYEWGRRQRHGFANIRVGADVRRQAFWLRISGYPQPGVDELVYLRNEQPIHQLEHFQRHGLDNGSCLQRRGWRLQPNLSSTECIQSVYVYRALFGHFFWPGRQHVSLSGQPVRHFSDRTVRAVAGSPRTSTASVKSAVGRPCTMRAPFLFGAVVVL